MRNKAKWNLYMREYRKANRAHTTELEQKSKRKKPAKYAAIKRKAVYKFRKRNPLKTAAYRTVNNATRYNKLVRPKICSKCGIKCKPDAHHPDYHKPLEVVWLCKTCHAVETWHSQ